MPTTRGKALMTHACWLSKLFAEISTRPSLCVRIGLRSNILASRAPRGALRAGAENIVCLQSRAWDRARAVARIRRGPAAAEAGSSNLIETCPRGEATGRRDLPAATTPRSCQNGICLSASILDNLDLSWARRSRGGGGARARECRTPRRGFLQWIGKAEGVPPEPGATPDQRTVFLAPRSSAVRSGVRLNGNLRNSTA